MRLLLLYYVAALFYLSFAFAIEYGYSIIIPVDFVMTSVEESLAIVYTHWDCS